MIFIWNYLAKVPGLFIVTTFYGFVNRNLHQNQHNLLGGLSCFK